MKLTIKQLSKLTRDQRIRYAKNDRCSHKRVFDGKCTSCGLTVDEKGHYKNTLPDGITIER